MQKSNKRYVYGTKTHKWYLVGKEDRDWSSGIDPEKFKKISKKTAITLYLAPTLV